MMKCNLLPSTFRLPGSTFMAISIHSQDDNYSGRIKNELMISLMKHVLSQVVSDIASQRHKHHTVSDSSYV